MRGDEDRVVAVRGEETSYAEAKGRTTSPGLDVYVVSEEGGVELVQSDPARPGQEPHP